MEIERKFLIEQVPGNLDSYSYHDLGAGLSLYQPCCKSKTGR